MVSLSLTGNRWHPLHFLSEMGGGEGGHQQNQDWITAIGSDSGFNEIADWITLAVHLTPNHQYSQGCQK